MEAVIRSVGAADPSADGNGAGNSPAAPAMDPSVKEALEKAVQIMQSGLVERDTEVGLEDEYKGGGGE